MFIIKGERKHHKTDKDEIKTIKTIKSKDRIRTLFGSDLHTTYSPATWAPNFVILSNSELLLILCTDSKDVVSILPPANES